MYVLYWFAHFIGLYSPLIVILSLPKFPCILCLKLNQMVEYLFSPNAHLMLIKYYNMLHVRRVRVGHGTSYNPSLTLKS